MVIINRHRLEMPGKNVNRVITSKDEWCAEAYMETDYSVLSDNNFISVMKSYAAYLTKNEPL